MISENGIKIFVFLNTVLEEFWCLLKIVRGKKMQGNVWKVQNII